MNLTLQQRDSGFCIFMYHPKWVFCSQPTRIREPWISHLPEPLLKTNPWLSFANHNKTPLTVRGLVLSPLSSPGLALSPATARFNHPQDSTDAALGLAVPVPVPSLLTRTFFLPFQHQRDPSQVSTLCCALEQNSGFNIELSGPLACSLNHHLHALLARCSIKHLLVPSPAE